MAAQLNLLHFFGGKSSQTRDASPEKSEDVDESSSGPGPAKKRKFLSKWLGRYSWLKINDKHPDDVEMTCGVCISTGKRNPFTVGCLNYQNSTLTRHQESADHVDALKRITLRNDFSRARYKAIEIKETELTNCPKTNQQVIQLRTVYVMSKNNIAADNFTHLMELQQVNGCPIGDKFYKRPEIVVEMENALYDVIEGNLLKDINESDYFGIMLDETCDISIDKKMVLYIKYIKDCKPNISYLGNLKITDCTANGIKSSLCDFLSSKGIVVDNDYSRLMGLGTDGASVMVGCRNGLGVQLQHENPSLVQVHCIAHRLNLAASQSSKGIPYLEEYKIYIQSIYRFYSDSSVRYDKLRELQTMLHSKVKQVPEGTSVRWLSIEAAVKMIYQYFDSIVMSLEDDKDATGKAKGIWKFVASSLFLLVTALLIDILTVVGILSLTFQRDHVNLSAIRHNVDSTIETLQAMTHGSNTVDAVLSDLGDVPILGEKNKYKETVDIQDNQNLRNRFVSIRQKYITKLIENLKSRFPLKELDILESFDCVLNPKRYPDLQHALNLQAYGDNSLERLCEQYANVIDKERCMAQFLHFKHFAQSYKQILEFESLAELILKEYADVYPDFAKLAMLALVIPVSSASCERGFSHQNVLKNKARNRLNPDRVNKLMMIKLVGPELTEMNFVQAAKLFNAMKKRKLC